MVGVFFERSSEKICMEIRLKYCDNKCIFKICETIRMEINLDYCDNKYILNIPFASNALTSTSLLGCLLQ